MQASHARLILEDVYASWERGDLPTTLSYFARCVVFVVHASPKAPSLIGVGFGRDRFGQKLALFLEQFKVENFELLGVRADGDGFCSSVAYKYIHRASGLGIEGRMRHTWLFVGDEIAHFELFTDSPRLHAFYTLAAAA
jgi:ketosteroid isomerase-like protein